MLVIIIVIIILLLALAHLPSYLGCLIAREEAHQVVQLPLLHALGEAGDEDLSVGFMRVVRCMRGVTCMRGVRCMRAQLQAHKFLCAAATDITRTRVEEDHIG